VVILGHAAAKRIFQGAPAVGQTVLISGRSFEVVGVMDTKIQDSMYEGPDNEQAFIPYEVFNEITSAKDPQIIVFEPISAELHSEALIAARNVIGRRHHFEPRDTKATPEWDTVESGQMLKAFTIGLDSLLGIIGALTLGVGGVGVMNIMLVSVTERTKEIGVRKSIGARSKDILRQFLTEAVFISEAGGILGIILGIIVGDLLAAWLKVDLIFPYGWAIAGLIVCSVIGIGFGLYPAYRAASLDPIEALRYE
jgi:putative ABC transport system permease protein